MKNFKVTIAAVMVAGLLGACSTTPKPGDALTETRVLNSGILTVKATITDIDYDSHMLALDRDGEEMIIAVSDTVENFNQLKIGDVVVADYKASAAVYAQVSDGTPRVNTELKEKDNDGEIGSELTETTEIISNIVALDKVKRIVTLVGPRGEEITTPIQDDNVDLSNINVGDQVVVVLTRAIAISIHAEAMTAPAAKTEAEVAAPAAAE